MPGGEQADLLLLVDVYHRLTDDRNLRLFSGFLAALLLPEPMPHVVAQILVDDVPRTKAGGRAAPEPRPSRLQICNIELCFEPSRETTTYFRPRPRSSYRLSFGRPLAKIRPCRPVVLPPGSRLGSRLLHRALLPRVAWQRVRSRFSGPCCSAGLGHSAEQFSPSWERRVRGCKIVLDPFTQPLPVDRGPRLRKRPRPEMEAPYDCRLPKLWFLAERARPGWTREQDSFLLGRARSRRTFCLVQRTACPPFLPYAASDRLAIGVRLGPALQ